MGQIGLGLNGRAGAAVGHHIHVARRQRAGEGDGERRRAAVSVEPQGIAAEAYCRAGPVVNFDRLVVAGPLDVFGNEQIGGLDPAHDTVGRVSHAVAIGRNQRHPHQIVGRWRGRPVAGVRGVGEDEIFPVGAGPGLEGLVGQDHGAGTVQQIVFCRGDAGRMVGIDHHREHPGRHHRIRHLIGLAHPVIVDGRRIGQLAGNARPLQRHRHRVHAGAVRDVQRRRIGLVLHVRQERHRKRIALAVFDRAQRVRGQEEIGGVRPAQRQGADGHRHLVPADVLDPERLQIRPADLHVAEVLRLGRDDQIRLAQQRRPYRRNPHFVKQTAAEPVRSTPRLQAHGGHLRNGQRAPLGIPGGRLGGRNILAAIERLGLGDIVFEVVLQHHPVPVVGAVAVGIHPVGAGGIGATPADSEGAVGPPGLTEFQLFRGSVHQGHGQPAVGALVPRLVAVRHQRGHKDGPGADRRNRARGRAPAIRPVQIDKSAVAAEGRLIGGRRVEHRAAIGGVVREHDPRGGRIRGQCPVGTRSPVGAAALVGKAVCVERHIGVGERLHHHVGLVGFGLDRRSRRDGSAGVENIAQHTEDPVVVGGVGAHHMFAEVRRRPLVDHLGVAQRGTHRIAAVQRGDAGHLGQGRMQDQNGIAVGIRRDRRPDHLAAVARQLHTGRILHQPPPAAVARAEVAVASAGAVGPHHPVIILRPRHGLLVIVVRHRRHQARHRHVVKHHAVAVIAHGLERHVVIRAQVRQRQVPLRPR